MGPRRPATRSFDDSGIGAVFSYDLVGQSGGLLAADEDSPDHQVEPDGVQEAIAIVGLSGNGGKLLQLLLVPIVTIVGTAVGGAG